MSVARASRPCEGRTWAGRPCHDLRKLFLSRIERRQTLNPRLSSESFLPHFVLARILTFVIVGSRWRESQLNGAGTGLTPERQ